MNPEFLREGCAIEDFMNPDRIVVGELDTVSGDDVLALYERFDCPKVRTNLINAELVKYSSNTLLATLVSFSNELYRLCESLPGADGETMMDGLGLDKRLAPTVNGQRVKPGILSYLRGGIGYGGSCLPKDVAALRAWAEERGSKTPLLDAVTRVNEARPLEVVTHVERAAGTLSGKTVAVLGLAFKADTDDLRDSPVLPLVDALLARGAKVRAYDPKAGANAAAHYGSRIVVSTNARDLFAGANVAILGTSWPEFATWDYAALVPTMATRVIVDGRNALRLVTWPAGTKYLPVGRAPS
jgi:nucleotide sugar dehydrogenase